MPKRATVTWWTCWQIDLAAIAFCITTSAGVFFGAVRPLMRQHGHLAEQQADLVNQQRKASQLSASAATLQDELNDVRKQLAESKITLHPTTRVNRQVASLTELINGCGLKTNDIQLGEAIRSTKYSVIPISMSGSGRFKTCVSFLHKLSKTFPDTGIASFDVSGSPEQPAGAGNFRFDLYWYASPTGKVLSE